MLFRSLVARQLLQVQPDPDDRRRRTITLTAEGRRVVEAAWAETAAGFARRLGRLADERLILSRDALLALAGALTPENPE